MMEAESAAYFPPPESQGGWRTCGSDAEVRALAGLDPGQLDLVAQQQTFLHSGDSWGFVVIRHGWLAREYYTFNVLLPTRFDIWSGTKSFTGTAWGLLLDESRNGRLPPGRQVELDSPIYPFIPEGYPLSDPRKERITVRHVLSMTSGIRGERYGLSGVPTRTGDGPFEHALGHCPNRYGKWGDILGAEPGTQWDYSDLAFCHLGLGFARITGREIRDVMQERVFDPIGIEELSWDVQGGSGQLGPHTNAHTGVHVSARELARFGHLHRQGGQWQGHQIVPSWWIDLATRPSQDLNPSYGLTWWTNGAGRQWPYLPRDAFAAMGFRCNKCYIVPSLDLVVARVGSGPATWDEATFIGGIAAAILNSDL